MGARAAPAGRMALGAHRLRRGRRPADRRAAARRRDRADTPRAIRALRKAGVKRIMMVTGDRAGGAQAIGAALDLDAVLSDCVPSDKVEAVAPSSGCIRRNGRRRHQRCAGPGLGRRRRRDGRARRQRLLGSGGRGDLTDRIDRVGDAVVIAQRARRIAVQSIVVGMGLSTLAMLAGAIGWLTPVPAR